MNIQQLTLASLKPDPAQPRRQFPEQELIDLAASLKDVGQQVPIIVFADGGATFTILDGERRYRAAQLCNKPSLAAVVLAKRPSMAELHQARLAVDYHRSSLTLLERSDLLHQLQQETKDTVSALAERVHISQPMASKLLSLRKLHPNIRRMIDYGDLDVEKGFTISQEPDQERQLQLASEAKGMTRDHLRRVVRQKTQRPEARVSVARFVLDAETTITVQSSALSLASSIDLLADCLKELRRGQTQGLNISTQQKVMRDRAAQAKGGEHVVA